MAQHLKSIDWYTENDLSLPITQPPWPLPLGNRGYPLPERAVPSASLKALASCLTF